MGISRPDEERYLAPLPNQMFSKNLRALKTITTIRGGLERLTEDWTAARGHRTGPGACTTPD